MNNSIKRKIVKKLQSIETGNFDTEDVELLLIYIREWISDFPLLRELADFVAHPTRRKGLFYEEVDVVYSKFKYMRTQGKMNLDLNNIPKSVFYLLFQKGIDILSDQYLIEHLDKNKEQLKQHIIMNLLEKNGAIYSVKAGKTPEVKKILEVTHHTPDPSRFIISQKHIIDELIKALNLLCNNYKLNCSLNGIQKYQNKIMICLFEMLQETDFVLHDGNVARGVVGISANNYKYAHVKNAKNMHLELMLEFPIGPAFAMFPYIESFVMVGHFSDEILKLIDKWSTNGLSATLKPFQVMRHTIKGK